MAAEDYIDPCDFSYEQHILRTLGRATPNVKAKRNLDIEWVTGQGEIMRLEQMEDSHLLNTVAYIRRRTEEHAKTVELAESLHFKVPQFVINKQPADFWIGAMLKELNRRQVKKIADAKQVLANT